MFHESVKNCEGCQIDDSSQKSHTGDSCCCQEWPDVVKEYWGPIKSTTTLPESNNNSIMSRDIRFPTMWYV